MKFTRLLWHVFVVRPLSFVSPPNLRNRVYTCTNRANLHLIYFLLLFFYIYISKRLKIIFPSLIFIYRCKEKTFRRLALDERKLIRSIRWYILRVKMDTRFIFFLPSIFFDNTLSVIMRRVYFRPHRSRNKRSTTMVRVIAANRNNSEERARTIIRRNHRNARRIMIVNLASFTSLAFLRLLFVVKPRVAACRCANKYSS